MKGQMNALQNQILMSHDGRFIYIDRKTITNIKIDGISVMQISVIVSKRVYFFPHKRHKFASCNIEIDININNIITSFPPQFPIISNYVNLFVNLFIFIVCCYCNLSLIITIVVMISPSFRMTSSLVKASIPYNNHDD